MNNEVEKVLLLYDGQRFHKVHPGFYRSIHEAILAVFPVLLPGARYTTEMLLGRDFWDPLSDPERRLAGRCVVNLVKHRKLRLRRVGCKHKFPARYELDE